MTDKILKTTDKEKISKKLHAEKKRIVIAGGCFDLLHIGHIIFLENAKKQGDILIVLLESDETITASKGDRRPVNSQEIRAKILSALSAVDFVILLEPHLKNDDYDRLIFALKPAVIATTKGDPTKYHKKRQAEKIGAQVIDVTPQILDKSTTKLINLLKEL
jgi:FAD synthetase